MPPSPQNSPTPQAAFTLTLYSSVFANPSSTHARDLDHVETQDLAALPLSNKGLEELSTQEVIGLLSYLDLNRFATEFKTETVSAI